MSLAAAHPRTLLLAAFAAGVGTAAVGELSIGPVVALSAALAWLAAVRAPSGFGERRPDQRRSWPIVATAAVLLGFASAAVSGVSHGSWGGQRGVNPARGGSARAGGESLAGRARQRAADALHIGLPADVEALLKGMALGDDSGLSPSVRQSFRDSSLTHVTAASGQNIALLLAMAMPVMVGLGVTLRWRLLGCGLLALVYVPLAGSESPIRRACIMAIAALVAKGRGGRGGAAHSLLFAAVLTVLLDPIAPSTLGWQLSFVAVASMLSLGAPLSGLLKRRGAPEALADAVGATLAATAATAPLIAHAAGRFSTGAVPANLIAGPAVAAAMAGGLAAAGLSQVAPVLAAPLVWAAALPAAAVLEIAGIFAGGPFGSIAWRPGVESTAAILVAIAGLGWLARRRLTAEGGDPAWNDGLAAPSPRRPRRRRPVALLVAALALAGGVAVTTRGPKGDFGTSGLRTVFIDVGQGDAELVADGDDGILIDTGPPDTPIAHLLSRLGINHLAAVVLTHGQSDHAGAFGDLLARFRPDVLIDGTATAPGGETERVRRLARELGVHVVRPVPGLQAAAGRASIEVLSPLDSSSGPGDPNLSSTVLLARAGGITSLLTADAESEVLDGLTLPQVDVLKLAHHGSADRGLGRVLDLVRPSLTAIEVGRNPYGHPAASSVQAAGRWGPVLRTDRGGSIVVSAGRSGTLSVRRLGP